MALLQKHERELVDWIQATWPGIKVSKVNGKTHPKLFMEYLGVQRFYVIPGSPGDVRGVDNCMSDLRKMWGPPPDPVAKERRTLKQMTDDMGRPRVLAAARSAVGITPESVAPHTRGVVAHYNMKKGFRLEFRFVKDFADGAKIARTRFAVRRTKNQDEWELVPDAKGCIPTVKSQTLTLSFFEPPGTKYTDRGVFGSSPADYVWGGDRMLVSLVPGELREVKQRKAKRAPDKLVKAVLDESLLRLPAEGWKPTRSEEAKPASKAAPSKADLQRALELIRWIETTSEWVLRKLRAADGSVQWEYHIPPVRLTP